MWPASCVKRLSKSSCDCAAPTGYKSISPEPPSPAIVFVGVEPDACPTMYAALAAGEPVDVDVGGIAADSLGPKRVGRIAFAAACAWVDRVVLVPDEAIRDGQRRLWRDLHVVAEPGGAASLGALIAGAYVAGPGERIVVVVCGANADPTTVV